MEERLSKADAIARILHPFELAQANYLETVADGKALVAKPGPLCGSALPLQIPKLQIEVADNGCVTATSSELLPEAEAFPPIPQLDAHTPEFRALEQALRHMVPVGADWEYYLLVERAEELEPALQMQVPRRLVTKRYLTEELYFLKGCHLLEGAGSLDKVLQRLADPDDTDDQMDEQLRGWVVLQVDLSLIKGTYSIPVMAEVLHVCNPDGTRHPDWDDTIHPHIFGPLPLAAVSKIAPVIRNAGEGSAVTLGQFTDFNEDDAARQCRPCV